jgi:hypothetical protein
MNPGRFMAVVVAVVVPNRVVVPVVAVWATVVLSVALNRPTEAEAPNLRVVPVVVGWTRQPPPCRFAIHGGTARNRRTLRIRHLSTKLQSAYVT